MRIFKVEAWKTDTIFQIQSLLITTANTTYRNRKKEDTSSPKQPNWQVKDKINFKIHRLQCKPVVLGYLLMQTIENFLFLTASLLIAPIKPSVWANLFYSIRYMNT